MGSITTCTLPEGALLRTYVDRGAYTDCYVTECAQPVGHAQYVEAFYTTAVFKLERFLLSWFVNRPSTDAQARGVASGELASFAAWSVEARGPDQLLMCDFQGRTRSWLMTVPGLDGAPTKLYFGSAVVPAVEKRSGRKEMGFVFSALLGFHRLYSRILLRSAVNRLARIPSIADSGKRPA